MKPLSGILGDAADTEAKAPSALSGTLTPPISMVTHREFGDVDKMRQAISENITTALASSYPLENSRYRLDLKNIKYLDNKPYSLGDQKKAIMRGESLNQRLGGEWHLIDKSTGQAIDKKTSVVAHVPYVTHRGTFIYAGNEYTIANQMRLKPGVFTREKENGILEAHFNTRPGTGPSFRVYMEPTTGIFRLGVGQSTLKMYPILKAMGVPDEEIEKHWGKDLLRANIEAEDPRAVSRAFTKLVSTRADQDVGADDTESVAKLAAVSLGGPNNTKLKSDPKQLREGMEIEKEHTPKPALTKEIAQDHLEEIDDYYIRLKKMEGEAEEEGHKKEGQIGAKEHDRKWTQLWFTGKLRVSEHNEKPWVLLDIHKGLCEAAYDSLKREGVDARPHYDDPHISVLRPNECERIRKQHGQAWRGAAKDGAPIRFKLIRFVSCIPAGWDKYDRVWFIECESPDLVKYREDLGFPGLPKHEKKDHDMRFHVTFAVHPNSAKKAAELFCEERSEAGLGKFFMDKQAAENKEGVKLLNVFNKMELDPDVTTQTLGKPFTNAGTPALLRASQKLLNINSGKEEVDDRDSLAYQTLHGPEDFFAERIKKDAGQIGRKLLWRSTLRGNVKHIPSGALTPQLASVLLRSGMGMPLEETNPMDINDQIHRVIRLGEGGIPSLDSVPEEARNVQPSHFGFIDPIKAPECYDEQTEVRTSVGWKFWNQVEETDKLACLVSGRLEYHVPERLIVSNYEGEMYGAKTQFLEYLVTPNHRLWVKPQSGKVSYSPLYRFETPAEVMATKRLFACGGHAPLSDEICEFYLPLVKASGTEKQKHGNPPIGASLKNVLKPIDIYDWCEFMGWYLSEGSLNGLYVTRITQSNTANPENCKKIEQLLNRLPFTWCFVSGDTFTISSKQLREYLVQFGYCNDKYIPPEIFMAPVGARRLFVEKILAGDGRKAKYGKARSLCTSSKRLAEDFSQLAFELGYACRVGYEPDNREDHYLGCYTVCLHLENEKLVVQRSAYHPEGQYYKQQYSGKVYCATVPGGLLYVRRNNSVGFWCGNSEKMGVDSRVAYKVLKGSDGQFYTKMLKGGKPVHVSAAQAARSIIAFPGEMKKPGDKIRAMVKAHQVQYVSKGDVDYELPSHTQMFSSGSNLVPMTSGIKGGRLLMGAKYVVQALPLKHAEAPLVQSLADDGKSFDEKYGEKVGAVKAKQAGVVTDISKQGITVRYADGTKQTHELYDNFPFNRKTFIHNTPMVGIGDQVKPGQVLAKSNYTDDKGTLAIGTNLRVAYMPYKGLNYEDAVVISESAAKRLSSEHMYQHYLDDPDNHEISRKHFVSAYPTKYDRNQLNTVDDNGVVKPGTTVRYGDPLILALKRAAPTAVHRAHKPLFTDASMTWGHEFEGIVTDVDTLKDGSPNITVKAYAPAVEGDKMAGRYGDKGVISKIIPDHEMIHDKDGKPYEILLNPLGVISRGNPSQLFETALGKIARKRGEPYRVPAFNDESLVDSVKRELARHNLSDTEDVIDPATGKVIPKIMTGERFMFKLHHTSESKGKGRGDMGAYTSEGIPAKGGEFGCFPAMQNIKTLTGEISIARIVEKRLGAQTWTYDEALKEWVYRPITDWFTVRARISDILCIELEGSPCEAGNKHTRARSCLYPTKNHWIYKFNGEKVLAGELKVGDELITWGPQPTSDQWSLMYGSLLGDAYLNKGGFGVEHSVKQQEYVDWKKRILAGLLPNTFDRDREPHPSSLVKKRAQSRVIGVSYHHVNHQLKHDCLIDGKKRISDTWLSRVTELGIAVWILDDGFIAEKGKNKIGYKCYGTVATYDLYPDDVKKLSTWLSAQLRTSCPVAKNENIIRLTTMACRALIPLIARHIPWQVIPKSKGFLISQVKAIQETLPPFVQNTACKLEKIPAVIRGIRAYKHDKPEVDEIPVYDITIDRTHRYTVGGALVSNSKRISNMEINSLLSHGATEVIRDAQVVRGQRNDEFWKAFRMGYNPPSPKVPFVYSKFLGFLQGAGINVKKEGNRLQLFALTDKDIDKFTAGPLQNSKTVENNDLEEIPGGLFDRGLTGGHGGNRWSHIQLSEPMPNPIMEEPIRRLLGLTQKKYEAVLSGRESIDGLSGGAGLKQLLSRVNVDSSLDYYKDLVRTGAKSKRDNAVKVLGYLQAMKKHDLRPEDWIMSKVPVIPPAMRPITKFQKMPLVADPNYLYKDLMTANTDLQDLKTSAGESNVADERLRLYDSFKAVTGLGDPVQPKTEERQVKGLLKHVFGSSPKIGMFQRRVLGMPVDIVGLAAITPNPELNMDQVGIPEPKAWNIYRPFLIRRLIRSGVSGVEAVRAVTNQTPLARKALNEEIKKRPVIINRAPTLHRFGFMSAWPVLTKGNTLQISPVVTPGFNADFDGDTMQYHVPVTDEAVHQAIDKMMPSQNLKSVRDFKVHYVPRNEFLLGLHLASTAKKEHGEPRIFRSKEDAIGAYKRGEIELADKIKIQGA